MTKQTMIIGVDAGALSISDPRLKVGVWRVTFELLKALSSIDRSKCYRLYSFAPIEKKVMKEFRSNMQNIVLSPSVGYMKVRLPLELSIHPVDVLLGLSQSIPRIHVKKTITFIYDIGFLQYPDKYGSSADKLKDQTAYAAQHSDDIVTISQSVKKDLIETYHIKANHIQVCYPGVSDVFTQTGKKEEKSYPYFLFVGSLWKGKNIPTLLRAFQRFLNKNTLPHHLVFIGGDYWHDEEIEKTIQQLEISECVHLLGHVPDTVLSQYYRGATALVTMTLTEGFCMPVVEAMASECPVIASNIGPISEITRGSAVLINPLDEKACAEVMIKMATDDFLRRKLRDCGLETAKKFSWNQFAEKVNRIME
jgi:alpha-1,3-rhamnosyl/mannosyltransferase